MDVALNVDVILLDIGRSGPRHPFPFFSSSYQDSRRPILRVTCMVIEISFLTLPHHTYLWSADSCVAEGTVCPISFVKDVLVRTRSLITAFLPLSFPRHSVGNSHIIGIFNVLPVGISSLFPILGSGRSGPRSCECRCDLHVPLQATEKGGGYLDLLSPMGHLQLHKCCDTSAIKSSILDSPQLASLSHYFCMPMLGTLEWHETSNPPPNNAVGCVLGDDILRTLCVVKRKLCIVPRDIAGTSDSQ
jgi:hypothetical protein